MLDTEERRSEDLRDRKGRREGEQSRDVVEYNETDFRRQIVDRVRDGGVWRLGSPHHVS
jgi:hypothetical protein